MSTRKPKVALPILMVIAVFVAALLNVDSASYKAGGPQIQEKPSPHEGIPLPRAEFSVSPVGTNTEQVLRNLRNSRYDKSYPNRLDELRPDTVEVSRITHFWVNMPSLPTFENDAVLLGEVISAHGYVSNDKTGAYSEFTIRVEHAFKANAQFPGGLAVVEREGADVQLPDGRIVRYKNADQPLPGVGRRYVFFLKHNAQGEDYHILTAYNLAKGRRDLNGT